MAATLPGTLVAGTPHPRHLQDSDGTPAPASRGLLPRPPAPGPVPALTDPPASAGARPPWRSALPWQPPSRPRGLATAGRPSPRPPRRLTAPARRIQLEAAEDLLGPLVRGRHGPAAPRAGGRGWAGPGGSAAVTAEPQDPPPLPPAHPPLPGATNPSGRPPPRRPISRCYPLLTPPTGAGMTALLTNQTAVSLIQGWVRSGRRDSPTGPDVAEMEAPQDDRAGGAGGPRAREPSAGSS